MVIEFNCPDCGRLLRTTDDKAGLSASCPDCAAPMVVPPPGGDAWEEPAPAAETPKEEFSTSSRSTGPSREPNQGTTTRPCPMCGEEVRQWTPQCPWCGEQLAGKATRGGLKPHRGGLLLVLAILGWMGCFPLSIAAWVMANEDLGEMQSGRMDPSGEPITRAARGIAVLFLTLLCFAMLGICLLSSLAAFLG